MLNQKSFWGSQMFVLTLLYVFAAYKVLSGDLTHLAVLVSAVLLAAHILEIPLAYHMLKGRSPAASRLLPLTILFGLIWWIPARRGLFKVR